MLTCGVINMYKVDIIKIAEEMGFKIYTQASNKRQKNVLGYVACGDKKIIVLQNSCNYNSFKDYIYNNHYLISLALSYYNNAIEKEKFYKIIYDNIHDIDIETEAINMILPTKKLKKAICRYKNDVEKISNLFEVPKYIVEEKIEHQKKLTKTNL